MGLFGKKKGKMLDLTENYAKQQQRVDNLRESMQEAKRESSSSSAENSNISGLGFFANIASSAKTNNLASSQDISNSDAEERRRRFTKRIMDLTNKIEDLSNQLYHLQQRVEVLERKNSSSDVSGSYGVFD